MVAAVLKRIAARMPDGVQHELRRLFFRTQIRSRRFATDEKEYGLIDTLVHAGDWTLDIGANVGHYTLRMSELVGAAGRVVAIEPVPATFALLAANCSLAVHGNVSLLNVAASDACAAAGVAMPTFEEGLANYYQAHLTTVPAALTVLTLAIDSLQLPHRIALAKIDVEGHELPVLRGMARLLERDHPSLIVETSSAEVLGLLKEQGYRVNRLHGSSNVICTHGCAS